MADIINADPFMWAICVRCLFMVLYTGLSLTAVEWIMHLIVALRHLARALLETVLATRCSRTSPAGCLLLWIFLSVAENSFMELSVCLLW